MNFIELPFDLQGPGRVDHTAHIDLRLIHMVQFFPSENRAQVFFDQVPVLVANPNLELIIEVSDQAALVRLRQMINDGAREWLQGDDIRQSGTEIFFPIDQVKFVLFGRLAPAITPESIARASVGFFLRGVDIVNPSNINRLRELVMS